MARRRMIDPNIWQSEDISKMPVFARYVFIGMISNADDYGKGRATAAYLRSAIFPYDNIKISEINKAIEAIKQNTSIIFYELDGSQYYKFNHWNKWQKVDHPTESNIPEPQNEPFANQSRNVRETIAPNIIEVNIREDKLKESKPLSKTSFDFAPFIDTYNSSCLNLPKVALLTEKRKTAIRKFAKEFSIEQFKTICENCNKSDHHIGKNDRGWKADFDFLMRTDKAVQFLEGKITKVKSTQNNADSLKYMQREYTEEQLSSIYANFKYDPESELTEEERRL